MVKKLRCTAESNDWVKVEPHYYDNDVVISFVVDDIAGDIFLTPSDARKLRKQIKKAIEAIEGTEQESEA